MDECLFCRIASGEMEADVVCEDDDLIAFRDIHPQAPVHVLIIPRKHISGPGDIRAGDERLAGRMIALARELAARFPEAKGGYRLVINSGPDAGQAVGHIHLHFLAGRTFGWPPG